MANRKFDFHWTEYSVKRLTELWKLKMSGSEIGQYFGLSRNAVIGKLHRLGLTANKPRHNGHKTTVLRPRKRSDGLPFAKPIPLPPPVDAAGRSFNGDCGPIYDIMELRLHNCRWPIGDPQDKDFGYCGAYVGEGPYCPTHKAIAYVPPYYRY